MATDDTTKTREELIQELVQLRQLLDTKKPGLAYKDFIEQSPFGIVLYKPNGRISYVNPAYRTALGLSNKALQSILVDYNIFEDEQLKKLGLVPLIKKGFTKEPTSLPATLYEPKLLKNEKALNNKPLWLKSKIFPIKDSNGKIREVAIVFNDVTDQKKLRDDLIAEKENLSITLQSIGDALIAVDSEGKIIRINHVAETLTGWKEKQALGKPVSEVFNIINTVTRKPVEDPAGIVLLKGEVIGLANHTGLISKDGTERQIADSSAPIKDKEGNTIGVVLVFRDISEIYAKDKQLKESEAKLKSIFRAAPTGIGIVVNREITWVNERLCKMLGYTAEEMIGKSARFVYPNDKEFEWVGKEKYKQIKEHGSGSVETKLITKNGINVDILLSSTPLDLKDLSKGVIFTALDITELKDAIKDLRIEKNQAKMYFDIAGTILLALDSEGKIIQINKKGCDVLKCDQDDVIGNSWFNTFLPNNEKRQVAEVFRKLMKGDVDLTEFFENNVITKGNEKKVIAWHNALLKDENGKIVGTFSSGQDITEKLEAEKALMKSEERLSSFMNSAVDGFALLDSDLRLLDVNEAALKIVGWGGRKEELVGQTVKELYPQAEKSGWFAEYLDVLHTGEPKFFQYVQLPRELGSKYLHIRVFKVNDGLGFILSDVTVLHKIEEDLQNLKKLESLGVLAGGIAHDFNNILAAMLGNISLAQILIDPEDNIYINLKAAEKAVKQATDLTAQLLTFSIGGAPSKEVTDISGLIRETVQFILSGSKIKCKYSIPDNLWSVRVDKGQINQVINNLVINAVQAMPEKRIIDIELRNIPSSISTIHDLPNDRYVRFVIKDYGTGIPRENLEKIYDPYFTTKATGSGLGLATVYSIINRHNGYIFVESEEGNGTTFSVYLPAYRKKKNKDTEESLPDIWGEGKILILDDEASVLKMASQMLKFIGYEVTAVQEGDGALEEYKKAMKTDKPFAAVLLDLTVPGGIGGKQALKKILEIDPSVIAVASSGYSNDPVIANFKEYGFKGIVLKPYNLKTINNLFKILLKK